MNIDSTLDAWREAIGAEHVIIDAVPREQAQTATFVTTQGVPAILRPSTHAEVQACVLVANQHKTPLYPISRGKNWGYGSSVPVQDGCVLLDLSRMNRIVDFNEDMAYVTVEPGVTQQQLFDFLEEQGSTLFLGMTGAPPDSSLIGNTLERGVGKGPYGERFAHACGLEVVLPTGESVQTGFGRFANAKATPLHRWGVGPVLDGLFSQSNLGIVTQMTFWLLPKPAYFQVFAYEIEDERKLGPLADALRTLMLQGLIQTTFTINNDYRVLSYVQQYPWSETEGETPLSQSVRTKLRKAWDIGLWSGEGATYAASKEQAQSVRKLITQALKPIVDMLLFFDDEMATLSKAELAQQIPDADVDDILTWYNHHPQRGMPTHAAIPMTYWRKPEPLPEQLEPNRDRCGFIWLAPTVPFTGQEICNAIALIEDTFVAYHYEPNLALQCISPRSIYITIAIIYDRTLAGEDERASACADELLERLLHAGYMPYRLGSQSMAKLPPVQDDSATLLRTLKQTLDPNNILAPGRYEWQ
ncbi:MAG: FAD-binding oxidoreductase [Chloroflexota bacterium]